MTPRSTSVEGWALLEAMQKPTDTNTTPTRMQPVDVTARIATFIANARTDRVLDARNEIWARHVLLDWLGVTLAARDEPIVDILVAELIGPDHQPGRGACSIVGRGIRADLHAAVMINAAASHALDYDDVNPCLGGHPGVVTIPVALALAQTVPNITGRDILAAIVIGYEAAGAVGQMMGTSHYAAGFHNTGTVGTFGATATAAFLLGLNANKTRVAFGLAASQAAGLKCNFGTMTKPYHAGTAAQSGMMAARLASLGMTAHASAIEATNGFAATQAHEFVPDAWRAPEFGTNSDWVITKTLFKYHAACFGAHAAMTAVSNLTTQDTVTPENVVKVDLVVPERSRGQCDIAAPTTGLEVKFSTQHLAAMVLAGLDTAAPTNFTDEVANAAEVVKLRQRISLAFDPDRSRYLADAHILLTDGRTLSEQANVGQPATDLDQQWAKLHAKFVSLAVLHATRDQATEIASAVSGLGSAMSVSELMLALS
ncbi:MAG: MmgE/PrpD family protein [Pseudomonadota bacterium]